MAGQCAIEYTASVAANRYNKEKSVILQSFYISTQQKYTKRNKVIFYSVVSVSLCLLCDILFVQPYLWMLYFYVLAWIHWLEFWLRYFLNQEWFFIHIRQRLLDLLSRQCYRLLWLIYFWFCECNHVCQYR